MSLQFGEILLPGISGILSTRSAMRRSSFAVLILAGIFAAVFVSWASGSQLSYGYNLNGQPVTSLATPGTEAVVLFFAATDCPICNRYIPEIQGLEAKYGPQHVIIWYVYPNVGTTSATVRQHEADYGAEKNVLLDPHHRLVDLTHAIITPEAAILVPESSGAEPFRVVYAGRIDNRYIHLGEQRPRPTQFDLERAIVDVLQHHTVQHADGPPVGCGIIGE
jgi:thiol-disulfide isomerase/thioredoxin